MRYLIALIVGLLLGAMTADASACGRCGLFGRRCRFAVHHVEHHQQQAYVAPSQNFIFNNVFPSQFPYLLAPGGQSIYGVQSASAAYGDSPSLYMDRAARFTEQANENAKLGIEGFNANAALAIAANDSADRRQTNLTLALAAMEANRDPTSQVLQVTIDGQGKMTMGNPAMTAPGPQALQAGTCSRCHDGQGTGGAPKTLDLRPYARISEQQFEACLKRIEDGTMPPKAALAAEQKRLVITALARLVNHATPPAVGPPPDQQTGGGLRAPSSY